MLLARNCIPSPAAYSTWLAQDQVYRQAIAPATCSLQAHAYPETIPLAFAKSNAWNPGTVEAES